MSSPTASPLATAAAPTDPFPQFFIGVSFSLVLCALVCLSVFHARACVCAHAQVFAVSETRTREVSCERRSSSRGPVFLCCFALLPPRHRLLPPQPGSRTRATGDTPSRNAAGRTYGADGGVIHRCFPSAYAAILLLLARLSRSRLLLGETHATVQDCAARNAFSDATSFACLPRGGWKQAERRKVGFPRTTGNTSHDTLF